MSMKLPSLDTAEGIVVLGLAGLAVYLFWKSASAIKDNVVKPLEDAGAAVAGAFHDVGAALGSGAQAITDPVGAVQAREDMSSVGDSGIDGVPILPPASPSTDGLGTQGTSGSLPQVASPDALTGLVPGSNLAPGGW